MKKLFVTAVIAISLVSSAFGKDKTSITERAASNFYHDFKTAKDVEWKATPSFQKVSFVYKNVKMEAFYNPSGEFIATSRRVALEDLPTAAKRTIAKKYDTYAVKEAIFFEGNVETAYYISAENGKQSIILKVAGGIVTLVEKK